MARSRSEYFVYMVLCKDATLYTGIATNVEERVCAHNGLKKGGARYTQGRRPVVLVYTEKYPNRSKASQRESVLKKLSREDKHILLTAHEI